MNSAIGNVQKALQKYIGFDGTDLDVKMTLYYLLPHCGDMLGVCNFIPVRMDSHAICNPVLASEQIQTKYI